MKHGREALLCGALWLGLAGAVLGQATNPMQEPPPANWSQRTLADLEQMVALLHEHSPLPLMDAAHPSRMWFDQGAEQARQRAALVKNEAGWSAVLRAYAAGFRDPHLSLRVLRPSAEVLWPGRVLQAVGPHALVRSLPAFEDPEAPPDGSRLLQCDGKPWEQWLSERAPYQQVNIAEPQGHRLALQDLLLDRGNPLFGPAPQQCELALPGSGETLGWSLRWRALPQDQATWQTQSRARLHGAAATWGVAVEDGVAWVGVPTFSRQTAESLRALLPRIQSLREAQPGTRWVIDLRGNSGGDSALAQELAETLFGQAALRQHATDNSGWASAFDWRASAGNAQYWRERADQIRQREGLFSTDWIGSRLIAGRLEAHVAQGRWRQGSDEVETPPDPTRTRQAVALPAAVKVLVLSNGSCLSSCGYFLDRVLAQPGVALVGAGSASDGDLSEVRGIKFSDGALYLTVPQKVRVGQARRAGSSYRADATYPGAWEDEAALRQWVRSQFLAQ